MPYGIRSVKRCLLHEILQAGVVETFIRTRNKSATTEAQINANREKRGEKHRAQDRKTEEPFFPRKKAETCRLFKEQHLAQVEPVGADELHHANSVIEHRFRLWQIAATESAIYALGYREHINEFPSETPEMASAMCRALTPSEHEKELGRLHRYEVGLHRQEIKDMAAFRCFQANRREKETERFRMATVLMYQAGQNALRPPGTWLRLDARSNLRIQ